MSAHLSDTVMELQYKGFLNGKIKPPIIKNLSPKLIWMNNSKIGV